MSAGGVNAFTCNRLGSDDVNIVVAVGGSISLDERFTYTFEFSIELSNRDRLRLTEFGGDFVRPSLVIISFINFVGRFQLAGVSIDIRSTKLGPLGTSNLLCEISKLSSTLVFGWKSPTQISASHDSSARRPIPFHQLMQLHSAMFRESTGERLQDFLSLIKLNPTRRFELERPITDPSRVRRLDQHSISSIFTHFDRLVTIPDDHPHLANHPLTNALKFGNPPRLYFPNRIASPSAKLSLDTPENRFAKHAVREFISIVGAFVSNPRLQLSLRQDCRVMLSILEEASQASWFVDAGALSSLHAPSQALLKAEGYRQLFIFWSLLGQQTALPVDGVQAKRLLEGKDMATLYEYWVFVKVLEAVSTITGKLPSQAPRLFRTEFEGKVSYGCAVVFADELSVHFNETYTRSRRNAYSTPLRPDVVLRVGDSKYVFDAKYRIDKVNVDEDDVDDESKSSSYKRVDLYKMHTYRDALLGVKAAFVVYPGTAFSFFSRSGDSSQNPNGLSSIDGVGAIPLRPASNDPAEKLRIVIAHALISTRTTANIIST